MTFTDAAAEVLRLVGKPLHYKEITDIAIEKNLLSHVGKSPEVTMGARLAALLKKETDDTTLVRVKPGVFALREWDDRTIKAGLEGGKRGRQRASAPPPPAAAAAPESALDAADDEENLDTPFENDELVTEVEAAAEDVAAPVAIDEIVPGLAAEDDDDEVLIESSAPIGSEVEEPAARPAEVPAAVKSAPAVRPSWGSEEDEDAGPDDVMRAEAVARATELFDEEDDDDQPILGGDDRASVPPGGDGDSRRRRRRRRRGRGDAPLPGAPNGGGGGSLPTYTATPAAEMRPAADVLSRGHVIDLSGEGPALDELAGREMADIVMAILSTFDRGAGPVSLRQIAETAQRRGRLAGDTQTVQSQVAACVRADNARRLTSGQRPRFRFAGGRVGLTDWLLGGDLARLEAEAIAAVERYREAARRSFVRKLQELPGHAFVEVVALLLERLNVSQLRVARRPGGSGAETHLTGILRSAGDEVRVAIVIRRDGRELGRERVVELRGSLHHYGPANVGWIFTAGQILSGARDESAVPGAPPVSLFDGASIAKLAEENDVAVIRARLPIAVPDVDFFEALRAS